MDKPLIDIRLVRTREGEWRASSGDAKATVVPVTRCFTCSFKRTRGAVLICSITGQPASVGGKPPPEHCPLRTGPVVLVLK